MSAALGRRGFLVASLAAATAACGRTRHPVAAQPVTDFFVTARGRWPTTSMQGLTPEQWMSAITASASAMWSPILEAFNQSHPHLRATFGPEGVDPKPGPGGGTSFQFNPALSCAAGVPLGHGGSVDLSPTIRDANLDTTALVPGLLAAVTDRAGGIRGIPMDFDLLALNYSAPALQKLHLSPPPPAGWSLDQFTAAVAALATTGAPATVFGEGLATEFGGQAPVWFGFAEGYGGTVFGDSVVLSTGLVYQGLKAYADILQTTWAGQLTTIGPAAGLGFEHADPTLATKPWSTYSLARFPRLPVPAVPADVTVADVPLKAPNPTAGATFAVWLATREGQQALTAVGYPPTRTDLPGAAAPFQTAQVEVQLKDLRFRPGGIFGIVFGGSAVGNTFGFDRRIVTALAQPEPERLRRLQTLEKALTGVLNGSMTRAQAGDMLTHAGI